ncbi:hypothetical protein [Nostoc sp. NIES-3756]|uniref:hypothetical protein n=1 Tax=Nostoc sp. NIES-3756 TaxID=1751286 RepID=UPI000AC1F298|nr:hypothetical protein [Nostoc sp. NIES-3756]
MSINILQLPETSPAMLINSLLPAGFHVELKVWTIAVIAESSKRGRLSQFPVRR